MKTMQSSIFSLLLLLLGASLGLATEPELSQVQLVRGDCPMFWFSFNGRCYKYVSTHMTWAQAEIYCVSQGANLVSIHSLAEHNFVKSLIQNFDHTLGPTWIGLTDIHQERAWMWSDGCPVKYTTWSKGQPDNGGGNEDCADIGYAHDKNWNDCPCYYTLPSVCVTRKSVC